MTETSSPEAAERLRVAVEPRRLQILQLIWDAERTVNELAAAVGVSAPAVSQHLSRLRSAGLVEVRKDGRFRFYRAARSDMGSVAIVLESFWAERLDRLEEMALRSQTRAGGSRSRRRNP